MSQITSCLFELKHRKPCSSGVKTVAAAGQAKSIYYCWIITAGKLNYTFAASVAGYPLANL